jgi:molybdopterin synthase sulfur carrier subunit
MTILLFGAEARMVGQDSITVDTAMPNPTCADVRSALVQLQPKLQALMPVCRFAVNHSFVKDSQPLNSDDELALIGLVGGG